MSNGRENECIRNFCERFCTVKQLPAHQQFLSSEELRKVRQQRPTIQTLYRLDSKQSTSYRTALKNLECINRLVNLL